LALSTQDSNLSLPLLSYPLSSGISHCASPALRAHMVSRGTLPGLAAAAQRAVFRAGLAAAARRPVLPLLPEALAIHGRLHSIYQFRGGGAACWACELGGSRALTSGSSGTVEDVMVSLRKVVEPDLGSDVVSLEFVKNVRVEGVAVSIDLVLNTPACPTKDALRQACHDAVAALPWVESAQVHLSVEHRPKQRLDPKSQAAASSGLKNVKRIIAVSSAKGGVGKSTVAVNLAYGIAQLGGSVGIFDADLQGPSLPTMCALENPKVRKSPVSDALMEPLALEGVKLMSYGYSAKAQQGKAAVMRGPMVAATVSNLVKSTDWGELDYLVLGRFDVLYPDCPTSCSMAMG
jgi:metal-sulfur cluster biosynthetic enzyme